MRDIPFELKLTAAASDPASVPAAAFDVHAAVARARAEQARYVAKLIRRVAASLRRGSPPVDPLERAVYAARCRDSEQLRRAAAMAARRLGARAVHLDGARAV